MKPQRIEYEGEATQYAVLTYKEDYKGLRKNATLTFSDPPSASTLEGLQDVDSNITIFPSIEIARKRGDITRFILRDIDEEKIKDISGYIANYLSRQGFAVILKRAKKLKG